MMKVSFYKINNHLLSSQYIWIVFAITICIIYLIPLIIHGENTTMLIYDNLDSNVIWYKILAESGMIFASNDAIIPNMMNGLPRLSYGSEFDVILWFYYFLEPINAYTLNIVIMHITAFFSMFVFANRYLVSFHLRFREVIVYSLSLMFALLPFWPSGGLTIPALPLVTFVLLNIYNKRDRWYDWVVLILLPFYSSFVLLYMFYIGFVGLIFISVTLYKKEINWKFVGALWLFTLMYLLVSYRLVEATFFNNGFVSHRTEFNVFFTEPFLDATRRFYLFFLNGHETHLRNIQMPFLLPTIIFSGVLLLFKRRLTLKESLVVMGLFFFSLWTGIWEDMLGSLYGIPILITLSVSYMVVTKRLESLMLAMLGYIFISAIYGYTFYEGFSWIVDLFPIFKSLSLARASFVQPLILFVMLGLALQIIFQKLYFQVVFMVILLSLQLYVAYYSNWHRTEQVKGFASFEDYYAVKQFDALKEDLKSEDITNLKFISFGMEPAVALYNGLHTIDGYSTNYPLEYKHKFNRINEVNSNDIFAIKEERPSQKWGSKLYIMSINSALAEYQKGLSINFLGFDDFVLKELNTDYFLSSYWLNYPEKRNLTFIKQYKGGVNGWDIYLYRVN